MKVSHPAGALLVSRMDPTVIELLLIGGRRKLSQEENRVVMQCHYRSEYGRNGYKRECIPYGMKWECLI